MKFAVVYIIKSSVTGRPVTYTLYCESRYEADETARLIRSGAQVSDLFGVSVLTADSRYEE